MAAIVRLDDEVIGIDEFIKILKLTGQLERSLDQFVRERLAVRAAKKQGIRVSPEEIQERADQFRRVKGLHRATDTNRYLDILGVSLDEFESFIADSLYQEKMMEQVCSDKAIEEYFKLNSPKFDSIEVSHIVLEAEGKAKEMISLLRDDPDTFAEMVREHSIAYTRGAGRRHRQGAPRFSEDRCRGEGVQRCCRRSDRAVSVARPVFLRDLSG